MIPVKHKIINESSGVDVSVDFSIKANNLGTIFHILRNQLYSDPILAVIREYSTNAVDAHILAGKPDEKVKVSLPSRLDSFFKVRDFGPGLSDEEVQEIFASYGESTKRQTQDATGMLGIGCKSGFAYNDSFIVNSYKDGTLTAWNAFIDPSNRGSMAQMVTMETQEPNGIEIILPVKNHDIEKFHQKALDFFSFWKNPPVLEGISQSQLDSFNAKVNMPAVYKGTGWAYYGNTGRPYALMGNIAYPITTSVFGNDISQELSDILNAGVILNFNIGELEFAASREALQYTPYTKRAILTKLGVMRKEFTDSISATFKACTTLWDAKIAYSEITYATGKYYKLRGLIDFDVFTFNGKAVTSAVFTNSKFATMDLANTSYSRNTAGDRNSYGRVGRTTGAANIEAHPRTVVVINDKDIINGIINRVVGLIENKTFDKVHVLKFKDDTIKAQWLAETGFDGKVIELSSLPKEPLTKYYPDLATSGSNNPKHSSSEFVYAPTISSYAKPSDYWEKAEVDFSKDSIVYVPIDRFEYSGPTGAYTHPKKFKEMLQHLTAIGIVLPRIFGLKPTSVEKAKVNPQMVDVWTWAKAQVENVIKSVPNFEQCYIDRAYMIAEFSDGRGTARNLNRFFENNVMIGKDPKNKFNQMIAAGNPLYHEKEAEKITRIKTAAVAFNVSLNFNKKPSVDIQAMVSVLLKRYPLLFKIISYDYTVYFDKATQAHLSDYIDLIDLVTP